LVARCVCVALIYFGFIGQYYGGRVQMSKDTQLRLLMKAAPDFLVTTSIARIV